MTDRYVGPGGADGNNGLTWANRKLTLNGVEDTPVVAGDTVYVGPGIYREELTVDVSGSATGGPVTYIGDVTGENTDSIGGQIRTTGSDDDLTHTRSNAIRAITKHFRTFRGFQFDIVQNRHIYSTIGSTDWIVEDCVFGAGQGAGIENVGNSTDWIIRRCIFISVGGDAILFSHSSDVVSSGHLTENCLFIGVRGDGVDHVRVVGDTVKNCTFIGGLQRAVKVTTSAASGTVTVNNCTITGHRWAFTAATLGDITENYNNIFSVDTARTNVNTGAQSQTYTPLWANTVMLDGIKFPWDMAALNPDGGLARIAGTGESADDLFGVVRPTVSAKKSWGALQLREAERETGTVQTGSAALTLADAGDHQIYVPVTATSTTFEVAARYESEYAGTLPRLIVRQPGQADQVDTMVAAADTWETLSLTFTPNANPPYVVIIFRSLNTSVTGDFDTYWDDLDVS